MGWFFIIVRLKQRSNMIFFFQRFSSGELSESIRDQFLDQNFAQINEQQFVLCNREFIDTTSASVNRSLPDGNNLKVPLDYYYQKIDSSGNTVTITAFGSQLIDGSATATLSSQFDSVNLIWNQASQQWYTQ
jgi:hypothetical protein